MAGSKGGMGKEKPNNKIPRPNVGQKGSVADTLKTNREKKEEALRKAGVS